MDMNDNGQVSGAEILIRSLLREGVDTIFGYPGGAIMPVYDALMDHLDEVEHILVRYRFLSVFLRQLTKSFISIEHGKS